MKNKAKLWIKTFFAICAMGLFMGCGSDDNSDTIPGTEHKMYKYTLTVNSVLDELDYFSFTVSGGTMNPQDNTLWQVNGNTRTGERAISINDDDFRGGTQTFIIESTMPLLSSPSSISAVNTDNPLSFSLKVEVDGSVKLDETFQVTSETFTRSYNF